MPVFEIDPGETERVINENDPTEYYAQLFGAPLEFATTESDAQLGKGQKRTPGDEGDLEAGDTGLWAYNPTSNETAEFRLGRDDPDEDDGFSFERRPRDTIAGVLGADGSESAPRSDAYLEREMIQYPVDANGSVVEEFSVPARADFVNIAVDDADGTHEVSVEFTDDDGNEVVTFDKTHSDDYLGDPANNDYAIIANRVFGTRVRVTISDTSAAKNYLDYKIYGR